MRIRWTALAADDFASIIECIHQDHPAAAQRVARTIYEAIAGLGKFPSRGRPGIAAGTRELVFPPWPYIVVYEVAEDCLYVLRVRHASRDWP